jgi:hypothetical protein
VRGTIVHRVQSFPPSLLWLEVPEGLTAWLEEDGVGVRPVAHVQLALAHVTARGRTHLHLVGHVRGQVVQVHLHNRGKLLSEGEGTTGEYE